MASSLRRRAHIVFIILGTIMLLGLSLWQFQRLQWKNNLIDSLETQLSAAPLSKIPQTKEAITRANFRQVRLIGRFAADNFRLYGRTRDGKNGFHVLTPFITINRQAVLINRGFVAMELSDQPDQWLARSDLHAILGVYRKTSAPGSFVPENDIEKNQWYWPDIDAISSQSNLELPQTIVYQKKTSDIKNDYPKQLDVVINLPNDHLQYAIFWFVMAGVFCALNIYSLRRHS